MTQQVFETGQKTAISQLSWRSILVFTLGSVTLLLGLAVIYGWHMDNRTLIQILPNFVPMQYNTALGFVFSALGLLACQSGHLRLTAFFGSLTSLLGLLTLAQYILRIDLGLDQLFMIHHITVETSHPGRMAPNTALCFLLFGLLLTGSGLIPGLKKKSRLINIMGAGVGGLAAIAMIGYLADIQTAYGWSSLTKMAFHTSFGFLLLSFGSLLMGWRLNRQAGDDPISWMNAPMTVFCMVTVLGLWLALDSREAKQIDRAASAEASHLKKTLEQKMNKQLQALERFARRWEINGGLSDQMWQEDAENYVRHEGTYLAIAWIDQDWVLRRVEPKDGFKNIEALGLTHKESYGPILQDRIKNGQIWLSQSIELPDGGFGFVALRPLTINGKNHGFLAAVFMLDAVLVKGINETSGKSYFFRVLEGKQVLMTNAPNQQAAQKWYGFDFNLLNAMWRVEITARPSHIAAFQTHLPMVVLFGGLVMTALLLSIAILSQKIYQRSKILDLARLEAMRAGKAKSDFLARMSHELRSPLNGVIGFANILAGQDPSSIPKKDYDSYVGSIRSAGNHLLSLIGDILDLSKIESGEMELETTPFSLKELSAQLISVMSPLAVERSNKLTLDMDEDIPATVVGDPTRLRQVLINLISNAIKFTDQGQVSLRIHEVSRSEEFVTISMGVRDTGIGIPEDKHETIFNSFSQVDSSTARYFGGTGLGLSIANQLVEAMGGSISLNSLVGLGSFFRFELKLPYQEELQSEDKKLHVPLSLPALKLLVVDDIELNRRLAQVMLENEGHQIVLAESGQEALQYLREVNGNFPDAILMDIHMPLLDGIETTRLIRESNLPSADIPIIALTADVMKDNIGRFKKAGMDGFVSKPMQIEDLTRELGSVLQS